jgi:hypothetical protein
LKKAQVSVEFAGIIAAILMIVLSMQLYFYYLAQQALAIQNSYNAKIIGSEVYSYLSLAIITNGYQSTFSIPSNSNAQPVNASVQNNLLLVSVGNSTSAYPLTETIYLNNSGNLTPPPFYLASGSHLISSSNNVITIV